MSLEKSLSAKKRAVLGRKVKKLRQSGTVPANIFGRKTDSLSIQVKASDLTRIYRAAGETDLIELSIEGEKEPRPVLIRDVQPHPVTGQFLHADFMQVDLTEKVRAAVPVKFIGEAPAVKVGNILLGLLEEVEVEALPKQIPTEIEVDVSGLKEVDEAITIKDLKAPKGVRLIADAGTLVCKIEKAQVEEEPETAAAAAPSEEAAKEAVEEEPKDEPGAAS